MNREEMIPVDRLVSHPKNPNRMTPEKMEKLKRHILMGRQYERIVVRSLELSKRRAEDHAAGKLEILAGHHRKMILEAAGHKEIACSVWEGVTDYAADVYLDTLNGLRGSPDQTVRAELLRDILAESSLADIERDLPDDSETLRKLLDMPVDAPTKTTRAVIDSVPMTIFCGRADAKTIQSAIDAWLLIHDPEAKLANREGAALVAMLGRPG